MNNQKKVCIITYSTFPVPIGFPIASRLLPPQTHDNQRPVPVALCLRAQLNPTLCNPLDYIVHGIPSQNTGVSSLSLLQGIFPTQGSNPDLPHCRQIFYQLSHKGSPRILEWVAYPFSSRYSQPRDQTGISCISGRFFTI